MGVFTQLSSNIKGFPRKFASKCADASCVNGPLVVFKFQQQHEPVGLKVGVVFPALHADGDEPVQDEEAGAGYGVEREEGAHSERQE